jgi:hypothetical protein
MLEAFMAVMIFTIFCVDTMKSGSWAPLSQEPNLIDVPPKY